MAQGNGSASNEFARVGDDRSPPNLSAEEMQAARSLLQRAFRAAADFDGSEPAEERLFDPLLRYDRFVHEHTSEAWSASQLEEFIAQASFPDRPPNMPMTINALLERASDYYTRLAQASANDSILKMLEEAGAVIEQDQRVFVRTGGGALAEPQSFAPERFEVRKQPRLALLIGHLRNDGVNGQSIYMDDLVFRIGRVGANMMRRYPYHIVQIPRLDMEIAVCDQVGEITFVKKGTVGPEFWAYMDKEALKARDDIAAIEFNGEQQWWAGIAKALCTHATPNAKINVATWVQRPSNLDINLVKASLLAHRRNTGEWLTAQKRADGGTRGSYLLEHGPYAGRVKAGALNAALVDGQRGLPGGSSIAKLNEEMSKEHGLDYINVHGQDDLKLDLIKASLLAHYQATGEWLSAHKRAEDGTPGYLLEHGPYAGKVKVGTLNSFLADGLRGLPGGSSIAKLNEEISKEHGLDYINLHGQDDLKLDLIKASLLAHYQATGEWLTVQKRADGGSMGSYLLEHGPYAGKIKVGALNAALVDGFRGLPGGSSIPKLNEEISKEHGLDYINVHGQDDLKLDLIKASLLAHYQATGEWLTHDKCAEGGTRGSYLLEHGPYASKIKAGALRAALIYGWRGLPGGSSIAKLNREIASELAQRQTPPPRTSGSFTAAPS